MASLLEVRDRLQRLGLIGLLPDGIGYGNVSLRAHDRYGFIVSASATGHIRPSEAKHFSFVSRFEIETNSLTCSGPLPASSESMSHGAIYRASSAIAAVIHLHDTLIWKMLIAEAARSTPAELAYGTPEIARSIMRLARGQSALTIVMQGHEDGVLVAGQTIQEALDIVLALYNRAYRVY
jgi:ribulose-5-phosphate 4-epimerase/fuculose-1-phosphate aldolase